MKAFDKDDQNQTKDKTITLNQFPPPAQTYENDNQPPLQASSPVCQSEIDNTYKQQASSSAHQPDSASLSLQLCVPRLEQKDTPPQPAKSSVERSKVTSSTLSACASKQDCQQMCISLTCGLNEGVSERINASGDWRCSCAYENFRRRSTCHYCARPKLRPLLKPANEDPKL